MHPTPRRSGLFRSHAGARLWLVGLIAAALLSVAQAAIAQSPGSDEVDRHPIVGAWLVSDPLDAEAIPSTTVAHGDGTVVFFGADGPFSGVWESTSEDSVLITLVSTLADGVVTLRADVTVAADGESFTATYTVEPGCLCGETLGELGPGSVAGSRIHVEPPGEPVGPLTMEEPAASLTPAPAPEASMAPAAG